jgi:hypothetical protein
MTTWLSPDDPGNANPPVRFSEILRAFFGAVPDGPVNEHPGPDLPCLREPEAEPS